MQETDRTNRPLNREEREREERLRHTAKGWRKRQIADVEKNKEDDAND